MCVREKVKEREREREREGGKGSLQSVCLCDRGKDGVMEGK